MSGRRRDKMVTFGGFALGGEGGAGAVFVGGFTGAFELDEVGSVLDV